MATGMRRRYRMVVRKIGKLRMALRRMRLRMLDGMLETKVGRRVAGCGEG